MTLSALELLASRASNGRLTEPAPDDATLAAIVDAALRAPDHALLRPWRVLSIRGDARAKLGDAFAAGLRRRDPQATDEQLDRLRRKPLRAPLLIAVAATPRAHPKVPEIEQVVSAGAVAHGILLGLAARGFAGMWRTGAPSYDPVVKEALGLAPEDHVVGFLYAGTAAEAPPAIERPRAADLLASWG
jgi:nitroreductase